MSTKYAEGVVDNQLRVLGVQGLRVAGMPKALLSASEYLKTTSSRYERHTVSTGVSYSSSSLCSGRTSALSQLPPHYNR